MVFILILVFAVYIYFYELCRFVSQSNLYKECICYREIITKCYSRGMMHKDVQNETIVT